MSDEILRMIPNENRRLRACLLCSLVKTGVQFKQDGCENCDEFLFIKGSTERVLECTSSSFSGCVALMRPEESWVGKWQHIEKFHKGIYAVRVDGILPEDVQISLEQKGVNYRPRNQNFTV